MRSGGFITWLLSGVLACLLTGPVLADESEEPTLEPGFVVYSAESRVVNDVLRLDAVFGLQFSDKLFEALHNGVTLNLNIDMRVLRHRSYMWDSTVASVEQRYKISYSPLTKNYTLANLNSEIQFQFPNFDSLLAVVSVLTDFPLLDNSLLEDDEDYRAEIRVAVDRDSLPVPLRLMSYVTSGWHFVSEWYSWTLDH